MIKIYKWGEVASEEIFARNDACSGVEEPVKEIIANVRKNGDAALFEYTERFDRAKLDTLIVSGEEIDEAFSSVEPEFIEILKEAAENIRNFHKKQLREGFSIKNSDL